MLRRATKLFIEFIAIICAGLAILVVMAAIKLSSGPLSVGFITPFIVGALEPEDGSLHVQVDEALLTWGGWERAVQLRAVGVKATDPSGEVRADIPELTIGFSGRALLRGQLAPTSLEIVGPRLTFLRTEQGAFSLSDKSRSVPSADQPESTEQDAAEQAISEPQSEQDTAEAASEPESETRPQVDSDVADRLLVDMLSPPGPLNKLGYLTSLNIIDAELTLDDRKLNVMWRAPSSTFALLKGADGLRLKGNFGVDIGGETAEFALDAEYNTTHEEIAADLHLSDIQPARFAAAAPLFESLAGLKLPVSGTLSVRADFEGTVQGVVLDLTGGEGTVALPGAQADASVPIRSLQLRASLTDDLTVAQIDDLQVDLHGPRLAMTGAIQGVSQGVINGPFELAAELSLNDLPIADLKRLWPADVAANAHRWVSENIATGLVQSGKFSLTGNAGETGLGSFEVADLTGGFQFSDVAVSYFSPLPPVQRAHGQATVHPDRLSFAVAGGEVQGLQIGTGRIDITGLDASDQDLAVEVVVRGLVRQVLTLLDHPRLGYAKALGVKPTDVGGDTAVRLVVRLPLIDALTFKQVEIAAAAKLRDITMPKAAFDLDLTSGDLTLQLDGQGMDINGTAVLGQTPLTLSWVENFAPKGFARQFRIQATVDDAGRRSMGLDFDKYVQGPVGVDALMTQNTNRANTLVLNADLSRAVLDVGEIGWRKEAGVRGRFKGEFALTGDRPTFIHAFVLDADGMNAGGNVTFAADGKTVSAANINFLAFGRTDVAGNITRRADGGYDIALKGMSFDAAPLLSGGQDGAQTPSPDTQPDLMPLGVALTLQRLYLSSEGSLANVSVRMQRDTRHWRSIMVDGQPAPDRIFSINMTPDGSTRRLVARSDDAGSVFRALGISENVLGGSLRLDGTFDDSQPNSPLTARLEAERFRLINAPVIAKLLSVALLTGILDSLRGEGIGFDRLEIPFTMKDDVIETRNTRAHGSALGITAEGWVNLKTETVGLRGTLVPAYAVNSILNNIPLIGMLLGGPGSGVFAATYRMTGRLEDPDISVNPLATLAPGFLRGLFGIFEGGVPPQPDAVPDPSREREAPPPDPQRD